jgi:hypothetical protein
MLNRWAGWTAAAFATLLTLALVLGDLMDAGLRRWWATHALTTDTVSGLLVLLITLLVVDQLVRRRQISNRGRAVAAQAAIMVAQAARAGRAVAAVASGPAPDSVSETGPVSGADPAGNTDGAGNAGATRPETKAETETEDVRDAEAQDAAADEVRTYMLMLLVGAPVLIENPVARHFLEEAQYLGAIMVAALTALGRPPAPGQPATGRSAADSKAAADSTTPHTTTPDSTPGDTTPGDSTPSPDSTPADSTPAPDSAAPR